MKKMFLSLLLAVVACAAQAQDFVTVDNILYEIKGEAGSKYAIVARQDKNLSGNITIPATITVTGVLAGTYDVRGMVAPTLYELYSNGVVDVEGGAFQDCAITSITLPSSITVVEGGAFCGCTQLTNVTLPEGLTQIGAAAFAHCTSLQNIVIPLTVTEFGSDTDYGFVSYTFGACSALSAVNIPSGVTRLAQGCFLGAGITELTIPAGMTELGGYSLAIPVLQKLTILVRDHRNLRYNGNLFGYGESLLDVTGVDLEVPNGSKDIYSVYEPWMNFNSISELEGEEVYIVPDQRYITVKGVKYMIKGTEDTGYHAILLRQDPTLSGEVVIPGNVPYDGTTYPVWSIVEPTTDQNYASGEYATVGGAFQGTKVTKVTLPSLAVIPAGTFADCTQLEQVVLADGTTTLGAACFANCTSLTDIQIPASVTDLGCDTDYGYVSYIFGGCTSLKSVTIPEGVTRLATGCFKGAGLETLTLPEGITQIDDYALELPDLRRLVLLQPDKELFSVSGRAFGDDTEWLKQVDVITPLGSARVYSEYYPWISFRSVTDVNSSYLKLDGSVFSAPEGHYTVIFPSGMADEDKFEEHGNGDYVYGLNLKQGVSVSFNTTADDTWVYVYLFNGNQNTVLLDGTELTEIGDDGQTDYHRYDRLVEKGSHTITCNTYEGNQWPCMFLVEAEDASSTGRFEPTVITTRIDGVRYQLKEVTEGEETIRTATVGRQNTDLAGDIVIPATVTYDKKEYAVTAMVGPTTLDRYADETVEVKEGAFQGTAITSITLPATISVIPAGAFFECRQLTAVSLPDNLMQISAAAFARCESLEELFIPETVTDLGSETGYGYTSYVFGGCTSLKKVNTPTAVTTLACGLFKGSGLETFLIPASVNKLEPFSFQSENLREFKLCHNQANDLDFTEAVFKDIDLSGVTLYVPTGAKATFSQLYPWRNFGDIIEYTDQGDTHQYNAYRVEYVEYNEVEGAPSYAPRRAGDSNLLADTLGYTPSGIALTLPETITRKLYTYLAEWKNKPTTMPANDVVVSVILSLLGDLAEDGVLDIDDAAEIINRWLELDDEDDAPDELKRIADLNGDGIVDIDDALIVVEIFLNTDEDE